MSVFFLSVFFYDCNHLGFSSDIFIFKVNCSQNITAAATAAAATATAATATAAAAASSPAPTAATTTATTICEKYGY